MFIPRYSESRVRSDLEEHHVFVECKDDKVVKVNHRARGEWTVGSLETGGWLHSGYETLRYVIAYSNAGLVLFLALGRIVSLLVTRVGSSLTYFSRPRG